MLFASNDKTCCYLFSNSKELNSVSLECSRHGMFDLRPHQALVGFKRTRFTQSMKESFPLFLLSIATQQTQVFYSYASPLVRINLIKLNVPNTFFRTIFSSWLKKKFLFCEWNNEDDFKRVGLLGLVMLVVIAFGNNQEGELHEWRVRLRMKAFERKEKASFFSDILACT